MAYFSNGTEGMDYEARFCDRCVHQKPEGPGCMVWLAHLTHNYGQCDNAAVANILTMLIPRTKDRLDNEECTMFLQKVE